MSEKKVVLNNENYSKFVEIFGVIQKFCSDFDMVDGIVRQRTDGGVMHFEMDMSGVVSDMSFTVSDMKSKYKLLTIFDSSDSVTIEDAGNIYKIYDDKYEVCIRKVSNSKYLQNVFVDDSAYPFYKYDGENIFEKEVTLGELKIFKKIIDGVPSSYIIVVLDGGVANLYVESDSKDLKTVLIKDLASKEGHSGTFFFSNRGFLIPFDSSLNFVDMDCVFNINGKNTNIIKISSTISGIPTSVFIPRFSDSDL